MKLTTKQFEALRHRLELPECIAEVLFDSCLVLDQDECEQEAMQLLRGLPEVPDNPTSLQKLILSDAIDGNTYFAIHCWDEQHVQASVARACHSLARKISRIIGTEVEFPLY